MDNQDATTYTEINKADILEFLRKNKNADRYVPQWITENDTERVTRLSEVLKQWMRNQVPSTAANKSKGRLKRERVAPSATTADTHNAPLLEEKFQLQNFDLIVWEYISKP